MVQDRLLHRAGFLILPAGEIHEHRVHTVLAQDQRRVEGAVRLADRAQQLARGGQVAFAVEVAETAQLHQVLQTAADAVHALIHEIIRRSLVEPQLFKGTVEFDQPGAGGFEFLLPRLVVAGGEGGVNARLGGLLVFQQQIGHAAIGRNHENTVVQLGALAVADQDIGHQLPEAGHAGSADLFYGMDSHLETLPMLKCLRCASV